MLNGIKNIIIFIGIAIGAALLCAVLMSVVAVSCAFFEENGHQMMNRTITVATIDQSGSIIDENGIGYCSSVRLKANLIHIVKNHTYEIVYFCDGGNTRRISEATDITSPPPLPTPTQDLTKCQLIDGVCR